ncbi:uncharacterized protein LOC128746053 [Sabethes cyaneus]|uniref:uncharacterized protein LOC128746053 n=1 Tax=Sabethes cyaneus TaxID=53552 RepID=UPI00237DE896|nr:uncharacterized protein LOC128746053 [Sabethes cyaneus]XP_053699085.1 uncharacterized protein LOC128746053 [Sabethes cyaneus]
MFSGGLRRIASARFRQLSVFTVKPTERIIVCKLSRFGCSVADFNTACVLQAKKFSDNENDYAREILQHTVAGTPLNTRVQVALAASEPVEFEPETNWCALSERDLIHQFRQIVELCRRDELLISDDRFDGFVASLVNRTTKFSDDDLVELLQLLVGLGPTPKVNTRNFLEIWQALDKECLSRVSGWDTDKLLYVADQWYPLRLAKIGKFVNKVVWKISNRLRKLTKDQLVRTMFYINVVRTPLENMVDIEINWKQNFYLFEIDDVAILCMGFFKTETPIRSTELIERIYQLTMHHAGDIKDISLAAILKLLRYSSRIPNAQSMEQLLKVFTPQVERLSLFCCLHLALLGSDLHLCYQPCIEAILERFTRDIKLLRLKDMERISFIIAHYNMMIPNKKDLRLLEAILDELPTRIPEITQYPKSYLSLLNFLSLRDVYSVDLITAAFEPRFLHLTYGRNIGGAGREVIGLDSYLRINLPEGEYTGPYFPEKHFKVIAKLTQDYVPSAEYRLTKSDRMLLEIQEAFQKRYTFAHIIHVLPHYQRPDVVVLWDNDQQQFLDVAAKCPKQYSGKILSRNFLLGEDNAKKDLRLIAIVAGSWNCYIRDQNRITGGFAMKLKQLGLIGFETIVIPWHEWPLESKQAKDSYLLMKLNQLVPLNQRT